MKTLIIATDGNDAAPATLEAPLATLGTALERAAEHRDVDTEILFREGTYVLDETAVIGKGHEPAPGKTLRIASFEGEAVTLSGGQPLDGWEPVPGKEGIWQIALPVLPEEKTSVHALYHVEQGLLPRSSSHASIKEGFETTSEKQGKFPTDFCTTFEARTTLHYPEGSLKPWENLEDVEIYMSPQRPWLVNYLGIASLDMEAGVAKLTPQATYEARGRFVVQNHLDFITEPGEWAVDTRRGLLYIKSPGEAPEGILLPALDELIRIEGVNDLEGEADDPVQGIHIEGLTLSHTDRAVWNAEDKGIQDDWSMWDKGSALIRFRGAKDCSVKHCTLQHTGGDGVRLDLLCQNISISHNHIQQTGGVGVLMAGYGPGYKDVNFGNEVLDNHIHDTGTLYPHSMGVFIWQSGGNRIAHNHVHHLGYMGMVLSGIRRHFWEPEVRPRDIREHIPLINYEVTAHLEGGKGDWDLYKGYMHCKENVVEYNEIHDCMRLLNDGNAIYLSATGPNNVIRKNLVYNHPEGGNALLRTDDDQFDSLWEGNVIIGNAGHRVGFAHKGINAFNNNLQLNADVAVYTGVHGTSEGIDSISGNVFLYEDETDRPLLRDESGFAEGKVDRNVYWTANREQAEAGLAVRHGLNSDPNSVVADPLFKSVEGLEFDTEAGSLLEALGIPDFEIAKMGLLDAPGVERLRTSGALMRGVVAVPLGPS